MAGRKTKRGLSLSRDAVIQNVFQKAIREEYRVPSKERAPQTARYLKKELRSNSAQSTQSSLEKLCAATEQQVEPQEAKGDAEASLTEARERQRSIPIVKSSPLAISALFAKNKVSESINPRRKSRPKNNRKVRASESIYPTARQKKMAAKAMTGTQTGMKKKKRNRSTGPRNAAKMRRTCS